MREAPIDLRKVMTWRNLYTLAEPRGYNTLPECETCPCVDCGLPATANPITVMGRRSMTARERTRVRILATFRNVRACDAHVKQVKEELMGLANRSSADKVRELLYQDPLLYTMEEVNALKATLIGILGYWRNIPLQRGDWVHEGVDWLRTQQTYYAVHISY